MFFFFQAEDGIRDWSVTGVQTCALPILPGGNPSPPRERRCAPGAGSRGTFVGAGDHREAVRAQPPERARSEERRVGKECRSRRYTYLDKKSWGGSCTVGEHSTCRGETRS